MFLEVLQQPNPVLREKCHPIDKVTPSILALAKNMLETMYRDSGVGLAAPQVGHPIQMIVFDATPEKNKPGVLINPKIISHSKEKIGRIEGCLSCRGFEGLVERWSKVTATGLNVQGKKVTIKAEGLLARVLQHEIDHINGVIIMDIAKPIPPEMLEDEEPVVE